MSRRSKKTQKKQQQSASDASNNSKSEESQHDSFIKFISDRLKTLDLCSTDDEYVSISEAIASSTPIDAPPSEENLENVISDLLDYFEDVTESHAKALVFAAAFDAWDVDVAHITVTVVDADDSDEENDNDSNNEQNGEQDYEVEEDEGDYIGEGECELCERTIKLTRHHLIPKSTWPRMKKRLWNAAPAIESYHTLCTCETKIIDEKQLKLQQLQEKKEALHFKLGKTLGMTDISNVPTSITRDSVRAYLQTVALLCRQCHSAVHRIHPSEWDLATKYNTMDLLLGCEEVMKFGKWASKQRSGKYAM